MWAHGVCLALWICYVKKCLSILFFGRQLVWVVMLTSRKALSLHWLRKCKVQFTNQCYNPKKHYWGIASCFDRVLLFHISIKTQKSSFPISTYRCSHSDFCEIWAWLRNLTVICKHAQHYQVCNERLFKVSLIFDQMRLSRTELKY